MDTHCVCAGICSNTPLENLHYCVFACSQSLLYRTWWCFVFISFVCTSLPCIKTGFSIQAFQVCVFVVFRIRFYCIGIFPIPFPIPYASPDTEPQPECDTRQHNPVPDIFMLITPSTIIQKLTITTSLICDVRTQTTTTLDYCVVKRVKKGKTYYCGTAKISKCSKATPVESNTTTK